MQRLFVNWVYGGALAGLLLLVVTPLLFGSWPLIPVLTFLHLPVYMLHQYEEHDDDRFRRFINTILGNGKELLSPTAVFVINVPGVWGVIAVSLWLSFRVDPGFALIAIYLVLVNGIVHVLAAVILRSYNPGLGSAILLFLPFGVYSIWQVQQSGGGTLLLHAVGFLTAAGIHVALAGYALSKRNA